MGGTPSGTPGPRWPRWAARGQANGPLVHRPSLRTLGGPCLRDREGHAAGGPLLGDSQNLEHAERVADARLRARGCLLIRKTQILRLASANKTSPCSRGPRAPRGLRPKPQAGAPRERHRRRPRRPTLHQAADPDGPRLSEKEHAPMGLRAADPDGPRLRETQKKQRQLHIRLPTPMGPACTKRDCPNGPPGCRPQWAPPDRTMKLPREKSKGMPQWATRLPSKPSRGDGETTTGITKEG